MPDNPRKGNPVRHRYAKMPKAKDQKKGEKDKKTKS